VRLALFGFLLFYVQDQQFESTWLHLALTNKLLATTFLGLVFDNRFKNKFIIEFFSANYVCYKYRFSFLDIYVCSLRANEITAWIILNLKTVLEGL